MHLFLLDKPLSLLCHPAWSWEGEDRRQVAAHEELDRLCAPWDLAPLGQWENGQALVLVLYLQTQGWCQNWTQDQSCVPAA